jgi:hypothetical protein
MYLPNYPIDVIRFLVHHNLLLVFHTDRVDLFQHLSVEEERSLLKR